ncbi:unnamed protein product, partial [Prorocentrum cordatum]
SIPLDLLQSRYIRGLIGRSIALPMGLIPPSSVRRRPSSSCPLPPPLPRGRGGGERHLARQPCCARASRAARAAAAVARGSGAARPTPAGRHSRDLDQRISDFVDDHQLDPKVKRIMQNMAPEDAEKVLEEGLNPERCRNPTAVVVSRIRKVEMDAGRANAVKRYDKGGGRGRRADSRSPVRSRSCGGSRASSGGGGRAGSGGARRRRGDCRR